MLTSQSAIGLIVGGLVPRVLVVFWARLFGFPDGFGPGTFPGVELADELDAVWAGADGATLGGGGGFGVAFGVRDVNG
jgi:hypothetical protein